MRSNTASDSMEDITMLIKMAGMIGMTISNVSGNQREDEDRRTDMVIVALSGIDNSCWTSLR